MLQFPMILIIVAYSEAYRAGTFHTIHGSDYTRTMNMFNMEIQWSNNICMHCRFLMNAFYPFNKHVDMMM